MIVERVGVRKRYFKHILPISVITAILLRTIEPLCIMQVIDTELGSKPDLMIWNEEEKEVHLMELTVPHEDSVRRGKDSHYEALVGECEEAGWKATHFPVEVGCRGFIATSVTKRMRVAGLGPKKRNTITKAHQGTVEKASHWIWLKREDTSWSES